MQRLIEIICEETEKAKIYHAIYKDIQMMALHPKGNYVLLTILNIIKGDML